MSPDLTRLIQLQELDNTIDDARRRIAAHPQRLADADTRLRNTTQQLDDARRRLEDTQSARRALEKDAALFQGRLVKFKDQLLEVKTNREYQALQHEIATAQSELGAAEEKVLERMMEADAITADIKRAEAVLAEQKKEVDREKTALAQELSAAEKMLVDATERRAALSRDTDARLIALYQQVAKARKGVAICTATRDGLCSVCHVRLRPQVFQQVRQNDAIIQCESCHRILYYAAPPASVDSVTPPS